MWPIVYCSTPAPRRGMIHGECRGRQGSGSSRRSGRASRRIWRKWNAFARLHCTPLMNSNPFSRSIYPGKSLTCRGFRSLTAKRHHPFSPSMQRRDLSGGSRGPECRRHRGAILGRFLVPTPILRGLVPPVPRRGGMREAYAPGGAPSGALHLTRVGAATRTFGPVPPFASSAGALSPPRAAPAPPRCGPRDRVPHAPGRRRSFSLLTAAPSPGLFWCCGPFVWSAPLALGPGLRETPAHGRSPRRYLWLQREMK